MKEDQKNQGQAITIQTYEENWEKYLNRNPKEVEGPYKEWVDNCLSLLDFNAEIFEIGTSVGRDADYMENKGFNVERSDVVESFINYQKQLGKQIIKFDLLNDGFMKKYDLIYANAVILHFNPEELQIALLNIQHGLKKNGMFVFRTKNGVSEEYSSEKMDKPRYFKYWNIDDLKNIFIKLGFEINIFRLNFDSKWIEGIVKLKH